MTNNIREAAQAVELMDAYLRSNGKLRDDQLWENHSATNRRKAGDVFSLSDHVRAMVYSMLSAERGWARVEENKANIDKIFCDFDSEQLLSAEPESLAEAVRGISCGNRLLKSHMQSLRGNIEKLKSFESQSGSIDEYYQTLIKGDTSLKNLVKALSNYQSKDKLSGLGAALVSEYLRNVGYDLPKPDRHITRILACNRLACSAKEKVSEFEAFDIIAMLAKETGRTNAEVDYILWSFCAKGYGGICTAVPNCGECVAREHCKSPR